MIFYFSGTGNSLYIAKNIARHLQEEMVSIAAVMNRGDESYEVNLKENERIGFVFPVYAWGPPRMVLDCIEKLTFNHHQDNYLYAVATCGDNIGNTMKVMDRCLRKKGLRLHSGFSVTMPNNYVVMGNIDSKEVQNKKLSAADEVLGTICPLIAQRSRGVYQVKKGFLPWLLTGLVNPLFTKNAIDTTKFHVTGDCTGCGLCEEVCNCGTIRVEGTPHWGTACTQCLACLHYCPVKAIQYGKSTANKGRYTHPAVGAAEMAQRNR